MLDEQGWQNSGYIVKTFSLKKSRSNNFTNFFEITKKWIWQLQKNFVLWISHQKTVYIILLRDCFPWVMQWLLLGFLLLRILCWVLNNNRICRIAQRKIDTEGRRIVDIMNCQVKKCLVIILTRDRRASYQSLILSSSGLRTSKRFLRVGSDVFLHCTANREWWSDIRRNVWSL